MVLGIVMARASGFCTAVVLPWVATGGVVVLTLEGGFGAISVVLPAFVNGKIYFCGFCER